RARAGPALAAGIARSGHEALRGGDAEDNAQVARDLFGGVTAGRMQAVRDTVLLNAAAGLVAYDGIGEPAAGDFESRFITAFEEARDALDSGRPAQLVARWAAASQEAQEEAG